MLFTDNHFFRERLSDRTYQFKYWRLWYKDWV